ncbi:hypothetical protein PCIT_a4506 [Pseudoalteromonas citrea]|uniref:Metal-dependent hydrolase n=2 Tax=Pseudoalteromonas citrea TaxID=43655 RepID=A0AAD4FQM1_9GAMM|nr:metal-dependent hydrolase [Pseudoalteromonas citrea]KAF7767551.1 hypothetical protein PCIT_a4506 [Pseudoalteromonas citrea]
MANFSTHLKASVVTSAALSTIILAVNLVPILQVCGLFIIGSLAGLVPDLDSDRSKSLNTLFSIFTLAVSAIVVLSFDFDSLTEIWAILLLIYGFIHFLIKPIFEHFTVHRGSFHSISAVVLVVLTTLNLTIWLDFSITLAVLSAIYVLVGCLTHLILDECYSVDINNREIKASFGSALKLFDTRYIIATLFQFTFIGLNIYWMSNGYDEISNTLLHIKNTLIQMQFLPNLTKYQF